MLLFSNQTQKKVILESKTSFATGAALVIAAVILFERYEQKDKSGKNAR
jgi:hypothetical protein